MSVSDTGQGIPRDFITSVFEPFRQADGSTTRPQGVSSLVKLVLVATAHRP